ncbi:hypothetical protein QQF64_002767 [Cirrhinus molitorella]|uniref:Zinc finger MYM-type 1-like protein n=1 Tax=Cirrhinus molitorella TaxID=172907 RepID=A0ABR3MR34_9TELE
MDIRSFFNKPAQKSVEDFDIYSTAADTDAAIEAANTSVPGTCSTSTATVSAETSAQPIAASGCVVNDLGEKATGPKQPLLSSFPKHQIGDINRAFSLFYYHKFPWIEYIYQAWKCGRTSGSVAAQLSHSHQGTVQKNREYMCKSVDIIKLLAKLGLPFRGHREDADVETRGNYLSLCDLFSKYDPDFKSMQSKYFNCTSRDFQNEIIALCAELVRDEIAKKVHETGFLAVIADEAKSSKTEQLSVCIRYTVGLQIKERFICFVDCSNSRDAAGIVSGIKEGLQSCGLKDIPIIAQSYDGASVMSGHLSGVQQRIREEFPFAVYVHCMAHKLNLVLVESCTVNRDIKTSLNVIDKLYSMFAEPSNHFRFLMMQKTLALKPKEIVQPSETRWACKYRCVYAVKSQYSAIIRCLKEMEEEGEKWSVEASGLYHHMTRLHFITSIIILEEVLRVVHVTHKRLQGASTMADAASAVKSLRTHLQHCREESSWEATWMQVKRFCEDFSGICVDSSPQTGGKRKRTSRTPAGLSQYLVPTTLGQRDENETHWESESQTFKRQLYLPVLDTMLAELDRRFSTDAMALSVACDAVFSCDKNGIGPLLSTYASFKIHPQLVTAEMDLLKCTIPSPITLEKLTNEVRKDQYPNFYRLLQLALTLPVSSAASERSFSVMRSIRNWLRSAMAQDRFSDLSILHIESDLTANLSAEKIVDIYANRKKRRILLH